MTGFLFCMAIHPTALLMLPGGFHQWHPLAQAVALGLSTLIQEDVPTVTAALLAAGGQLPWYYGWAGCFLGIWLGDLLLYLVARGLGRPLLQYHWVQRWIDPLAVQRSEEWFQRRGTGMLFISRFLPGTRLPTYLAAGLLRMPFTRFLLMTGIAVSVWTTLLFLLGQSVGTQLLNGLHSWNAGWISTLLAAGLIVLAVRALLKWTSASNRQRSMAWLGRWARWEFWPPWLFYFPVAIHYLWLSIRHRGLTVPTASNPGIFSGGLVGESKMATLDDLQKTSPHYVPTSVLIQASSAEGRFLQLDMALDSLHLQYPIILKPDVGQRGVGVKLIRDRSQAEAYLRRVQVPVVIQAYVAGPFEVGIFYYRMPGECHGRIFAITEKVFPVIQGDGVRTVEQLIWDDPRAKWMAGVYLQRLGERGREVLSVGQTLRLVEAGNHAQGCIFKDGMHLWTEALEQKVDEISRKLDGFYVGRYDLRYATEEGLRTGLDFQILELNGAASEATSIYDSSRSLAAAYGTLFRQWSLVFAIGDANRRRGVAPLPLFKLWRAWRETVGKIATYPLAD